MYFCIEVSIPSHFPLDVRGSPFVQKNGRGKAIREGRVTVQEGIKQGIGLQYGKTIAKILTKMLPNVVQIAKRSTSRFNLQGTTLMLNPLNKSFLSVDRGVRDLQGSELILRSEIDLQTKNILMSKCPKMALFLYL